jgi:hypothetical protein
MDLQALLKEMEHRTGVSGHNENIDRRVRLLRKVD